MITSLNEDELKANQDEYLKWRSTRIGSSDVPAILGKSPFKTARQLCKEKLGMTKSGFFTSLPIELGKKFEDTVRANIEMKLDIDFPPTILQSEIYPFMTASLDGYNKEHELVLEIKSVLGEPTYLKACEGICSDAYIDQVQHQLWVSKAKKNLFYVAKLEKFFDEYRIVDTKMVPVEPDEKQQEIIVKACLEFWTHMQNGTLPPHSSEDPIEIGDEEAVKLLADKTKLIDYCLKVKEHNYFEIRNGDQSKIASLKQNKKGTWVLRKEELIV
jgi:putative phage-type endonuclease